MHKKTSNFDRVFIEALLHLCVCVCVFNQSTSSTFLLIEIFEQWIGTTTQIKCGNLYLPNNTTAELGYVPFIICQSLSNLGDRNQTGVSWVRGSQIKETPKS